MICLIFPPNWAITFIFATKGVITYFSTKLIYLPYFPPEQVILLIFPTKWSYLPYFPTKASTIPGFPNNKSYLRHFSTKVSNSPVSSAKWVISLVKFNFLSYFSTKASLITLYFITPMWVISIIFYQASYLPYFPTKLSGPPLMSLSFLQNKVSLFFHQKVFSLIFQPKQLSSLIFFPLKWVISPISLPQKHMLRIFKSEAAFLSNLCSHGCKVAQNFG